MSDHETEYPVLMSKGEMVKRSDGTIAPSENGYKEAGRQFKLWAGCCTYLAEMFTAMASKCDELSERTYGEDQTIQDAELYGDGGPETALETDKEPQHEKGQGDTPSQGLV